MGHTHLSNEELAELLGKGIFDNPKPTKLIKRMIELVASKSVNDIVLDFFAGSATTAQAVMDLNAEDGGNRKYIMVQLPEKTDKNSEAQKAGYETITDIAKERIRRAGKKIKQDSKDKEGIEKLDIAFKAARFGKLNKFVKSGMHPEDIKEFYKWFSDWKAGKIDPRKYGEFETTIERLFTRYLDTKSIAKKLSMEEKLNALYDLANYDTAHNTKYIGQMAGIAERKVQSTLRKTGKGAYTNVAEIDNSLLRGKELTPKQIAEAEAAILKEAEKEVGKGGLKAKYGEYADNIKDIMTILKRRGHDIGKVRKERLTEGVGVGEEIAFGKKTKISTDELASSLNKTESELMSEIQDLVENIGGNPDKRKTPEITARIGRVQKKLKQWQDKLSPEFYQVMEDWQNKVKAVSAKAMRDAAMKEEKTPPPPFKGLTKEIKSKFREWVNTRQASKLEAVVKKKEFTDLDSKGIEGIFEFQAGSQKGKYKKLRNYFDNKFKEVKRTGMPINYQQDYLTQIWVNTKEEVNKVFGRRLGKRPSFTLEKVIEDYKKGIELGLTPKFENLSN